MASHASATAGGGGDGGGAGCVQASPPVCLEFRGLSVALKTSLADRKPPPLLLRSRPHPHQPLSAAEHAFPKHQLHGPAAQGACSTVSPPKFSSSLAASSSSSSSSSSHSTPNSFEPSPASASPLQPSAHPSLHGPSPAPPHGLPSPPEFSFARAPASGGAAGSTGAPRGPASEPPPPRGRPMVPPDEDGRQSPTPTAPIMVFHSAASAAVHDAVPLHYPIPSPPSPPPQQQQQDAVRPKKLILNDVSGFALPGQLTAIMGASGAGKTTLLNVLSGRHSSSTSRLSAGSILINGVAAPYGSLSRASAFVQQNDLLLPSLTVREIIRFAARLKLPRTVTAAQAEERVSQVIDELALRKCEHFMVGSSGAGDADAGSSGSGGGGGGGGGSGTDPSAPGQPAASKPSGGVSRSGISGGEQRRVSIGMELVTDPQLLFCDEPTSGLDSSTAYTIVSLLKRLAQSRGRTIVLTIHSPSSKIFALFDRLLLLTPCPGGARLAFQGPASAVLAHFERMDLGLETLAARLGRASARMTVSDYLMALLARRSRAELRTAREHARLEAAAQAGMRLIRDDRTPEKEEAELDALIEEDEARIGAIVSFYAREPDRLPEDAIPSLHAGGGADAPSLPLLPGSSATISWLQQLRHLTYRAYLTHVREVSHLRWRLFTNLFLSLFVGLLYLAPSHEASSSNYNQRSIFNRVGFVFFVTCMQALITLVNAVLTFSEERGLFLREKSSNLYATSAYFLAKTVIELPLNTALSFVFGSIGYAMVGMNNEPSHFLKFQFLLSLLGHSMSSIGLLLSCAIPIPIVSVMVTPITVIPFMLTSGFFINKESLPVYIEWLTHISPHRYAFAGFMGLEFDQLALHCDDDEINSVLLSASSATPQLFSYCSMILGRQVLAMLGLPSSEYWTDVLALCLLALGFRLVAFLVLEASVRENRLKMKEFRRRALKRLFAATRRAAASLQALCRGDRRSPPAPPQHDHKHDHFQAPSQQQQQPQQ